MRREILGAVLTAVHLVTMMLVRTTADWVQN